MSRGPGIQEWVLPLLVCVLALTGGCGGGGGGGGNPGTRLESISVTPSPTPIPAGLTRQLTATGAYSDGTSVDISDSVTWASDDTGVATIDASGLAAAVGAGSALITATSGTISGSATLTVSAATLVSIAVTPTDPSIPAGLTQQLTATGTYSDASTADITDLVAWASDDTGVATVDATGLATGVAGGSAQIRATSGTLSGSATLTVSVVSSYAVGGTVTGLAGSGLVLQNNGGDDLPVNADGSFTFTTGLSDAADYQVSVSVQPTSPGQFCNVFDFSGTISGADVTDIAVVCTTGLYNVVDTNQTTCYNDNGSTAPCVGTGYDADYEGTQADYTRSGDGTMVIDNVTGLIWTAEVDTDGSGVVDSSDKLTQADAVTYCTNFALGGYEWRLPSIKELYSLMQFSGGDPSGYNGTDTSVLTRFIDDTYFQPAFGDTDAGERLIDGQYATTSIYASPLGTMGGNDTMFGVNFVDGRIKGYPYAEGGPVTKTFFVHCVTGNTSYGINDFVDNGDGTISDQATGLMWEQDDYRSANFGDAVTHCESATTAGYDDWRLPDIKELQSILDYDRAPDVTSSAAIDPLFTATSFTNEGGDTDWGYYWSSTTHATYDGVGFAAAYMSFGRALGYYEVPGSGGALSFDDVHGAGAQRSDDKDDNTQGNSSANLGFGTFYYFGPQGDIRRLENMVRCVR